MSTRRNMLSTYKMEALIRESVQLEGHQTNTAKRLGISPQYLNDVIRGRRDISDEMARKFGYRRVVLFEPLEEE